MARNPFHDDAVPRNLPEVQHADISRYIAHLRATQQLPTEAGPDIEGNRHAVRIAAAASTETAWEHGRDGQCAGTLTRVLAKALQEAWENTKESGQLVSWRTILLRVREIVNVDFPQQNPYVDGPHTRVFFSLDETVTGALVLKPYGEDGIILAGRVSGVREGNVYALMPLGAERPSDEGHIGMATVDVVNGFKARAQLSLSPGKGPVPMEGVTAFLVEEALNRLPVAHPEGPDVLLDAIGGSKFLCRRDSNSDESLLVEFRYDGQDLVLANQEGVLLARRHISDTDPNSWATASRHLVEQAEQLARIQHLLALTYDNPGEKLEHRLDVQFGTVKSGAFGSVIEKDGKGSVIEGESVYISLKNNGSETVYVSVFDINVAGKISHISTGNPNGIELPPGRDYILGEDQFGLGLEGLLFTWPPGIVKTKPVAESIILILTDSQVDLRHLANTALATFRGNAGPSSLERLTFRLATGARRDVGSQGPSRRVRYSIESIHFTVEPIHNEDVDR